MFPNPTSGQVTIYRKIASENNSSHVEIVDLQGNLVLKEILRTTTATIDVASLPAGMYFLGVTLDDKTSTEYTKLCIE